ncbi:MAG: hypothetical protein J7604_15770 [Sporocytophaga sp.]|uniref:hypothetical protein n=1 Tax=Sporocytophaga sp. TaxID=2231183 RepID=UPI001B1254B6|nr:hypothetical protein [Sporocytophaga sp.]MBO9701664.1 hypothetical protein [Sporocytophaga sp.]
MKESINIWGIKEYEDIGASCPYIPAKLPWYKKVLLFFFRFGVCPACMTMSIAYSLKGARSKIASQIKVVNKPS